MSCSSSFGNYFCISLTVYATVLVLPLFRASDYPKRPSTTSTDQQRDPLWPKTKLIVSNLFLVYWLIMPRKWRFEVRCNINIPLSTGVPSSPRLMKKVTGVTQKNRDTTKTSLLYLFYCSKIWRYLSFADHSILFLIQVVSTIACNAIPTRSRQHYT